MPKSGMMWFHIVMSYFVYLLMYCIFVVMSVPVMYKKGRERERERERE